MQDLVKIVVNGSDIAFETFESFSLSKSLSQFHNQCTLTGVVRQPIINGKKQALNKITTEDEVKIYINGILQLTGYIWQASVFETADNVNYSLEIADKTKDLESSGTPKTYNQRNLEVLTRAVLDDNGFTDIKIENQIGTILIKTTEDITLDVGDSIQDFITRYATKNQVNVITNSKGNLVFLNESNDSSGTELLSLATTNNLQTNLKSSVVTISRRAKEVQIFAQSDVDDFTKNSILQIGKAVDELLTNNMKSIQQATTQSNNANLNEIAKYIINRKRAESGKYPCTVAGWRKKSNDKTPWEVNTLVRVKNELQKIDNEMLIESVEFTKDMSGTITNLVLVNKGTYTTDIKEATKSITKSRQINSIFI